VKLMCDDIKRHLKRRKEDPEYNAMAEYQYDVLKKKTSEGIALSKVTKHESTKNGALRMLTWYCNNDFISNIMKKKAIVLEEAEGKANSKQTFRSRKHHRRRITPVKQDERNQKQISQMSTNKSSNGSSTQSKEKLEDGARLSPKVGEIMSDENKAVWIKVGRELRENAGKPKGFGKQYSNRKANL
jgi:hypothetical protein